MDIGTIKPGDTVLEIVHPGSGIPLGIRVHLISIEDERMKKIKRKIEDEARKLQLKRKTFTAIETNENQNRICFAAMTKWEWFGVTIKNEDTGELKQEPVTFHGENPSMDQPTVFRVFEELPWFRDQIIEKLDETQSFFQK